MVTSDRVALGQMGDRDAAALAVELDAAMPHVVLDPSRCLASRAATAPPACPASRRAAGRPGAASRRRAPTCPAAALAPQRAGRPAEQLAEGLVEAAHAAEARGQRHLGHRQVRVVDQLLGEQHAPRLRDGDRARRRDAAGTAAASCRPPTPSRSARASTSASLVVERAVGDQRQRARSPCWTVPRQKASSGAISGRQRRQGRKPASCAAAAEAKKRQFSNFGRARRADRPAIDAGRGHAHEDAAVEAGVAGLEGAVAGSAVEQFHGGDFARPANARGFRTSIKSSPVIRLSPRPQGVPRPTTGEV